MKDVDRAYAVLMESAGWDAAHHELPDVQRAFGQLADEGLLGSTSEAERVRMAELYGIRYALLRAALQADPDAKPTKTVLDWSMQDHRLSTELADDGAASVPTGDEQSAAGVSDFNIMAELVSDPQADVSLPPEKADALRRNAENLRTAISEMLRVIGLHLGIPSDPAKLDDRQRREVVTLLRDEERINELIGTQAQYQYPPKLLDASVSIASWLVSQRKPLR